MIENIAYQTNLYSVQKCGKCVAVTKKEVEQVIGMFYHMGLARTNSVRQYWEVETNYTPVTDVMSRNRFRDILTKLHFVDNETVTDDEKKDRLWKIRPFLNNFRNNLLLLTPSQFCCIDEMMCQYRGKTSPIRQYIKGKPHPWGFKIWARADPQGILYDFDVYQGGDGTRTELGQGADVVLKLTSTLNSHANYKIYADNLFTSIPLIKRLQERGMLYTGTARSNRLPGLTVMSQSDLSKKGRGSYDYKVEQINNISAVRWMDSKAVTLLSSKTGLEPMQEAQRWVKKDHAFKTIPLPAVIADYNSHMGGVDLLDAFLMSFRFKMRSRRWYIYLFWHFVMVAIVNSWNIYRRDCKLLRVPKKEILSRRKFQVEHVNIVE